jgi:Uma2 family endonuclease
MRKERIKTTHFLDDKNSAIMSLQRQEKSKNPRAKKQNWTLEQYFDREYKVEGKHEFLDGEIRAMAYTSVVHGELITNLLKQLFKCSGFDRCNIFTSDRMLYAKDYNKIFYPDLQIICEDHKTFNYKGKMEATLNPSVLIEITSPSTESEDRIDKWACYKTIPSLKQYFIVSHRKKAIEAYNRMEEDSNKWINSEAKEDEDFVEIGDCKILLKDIYNKVQL